MAGDLIPPPSPAGKPEAEGLRRAPEAREPFSPIADAVMTARPEDARVVDPPSAMTRHRSRFGFIMGALAGTGVAALVVTILIVVGGGTTSDSGLTGDWSAWKPESKDTFSAAAEIGAHVAARYRLNDGGQLATISAGPIAFRDEVPARVVIRTAAVGGDIVPIDGKGILYTFNGLGEGGSIPSEKPSVERLALLKRAAIEIALYTFRYVGGADHVVLVLPPPPPAAAAGTTAQPSGPTGPAGAAEPSTVLFFRAGDLRAQLQAPLAATIPQQTPRPATIKSAEVQAITAETAPQTFLAAFQQTADGKVFLVLERPKPAAAGTATATPAPKLRKKKP